MREILTEAQARERIIAKCDELKTLLLEKNAGYGNSAFTALDLIDTLNPSTRLGVRIEDKIRRLMKGREYNAEDTVQDLTGYLVLYAIALERERELIAEAADTLLKRAEAGDE
jgi:hypothetical protein